MGTPLFLSLSFLVISYRYVAAAKNYLNNSTDN